MMLSVGRIFAGGGQGGVATTGDSQSGGRRRAPGGWRYLWEQVAKGAEDYYSADVARGEADGRWGGSAAKAELGLSGEVTEDQMERVFGLLMHPTDNEMLGQGPRHYRSLAQRLEAAQHAHQEQWTIEWAQREMDLVDVGASGQRIISELDAHRAGAAERWAESEATIRRGGERAAVAGFDLTFSPPKSVSVLWAAADRDGRETIWRAHREGVAAALGYIEREAAWSRMGYNGVRQVDTTGMVIASFDHRMSRRGDVQIHTHNAVLNRVRCDDGQWRALDGRAVYQAAASAGALYDRVREAALERDLGVRHEQRKPGGPREIAGVDDDVCRLFSSRRVQVEGRLAELVAAYTQRCGAAPTEWMTAQMSRWATLQTRTAKASTETTEAALARWEAESRAQLGRSLAGVWDQAIAAGGEDAAEKTGPVPDPDALAEAIATVDADKSTWTRYDLARQLTLTLHVDRGVDGAALLARVDRLVDGALASRAPALGVVNLSAPAVFDTPAGLRRSADGISAYEKHGAERFTTDEGVARELRVLAAARRVDGPRLDVDNLDACLAAEAAELTSDQAEAARQVLTSGRNLEALVGPAGSGKTHTMGAVARAWRASGGQVMGLAVAETAARTLADEAGIATVNTAKLLFEHRHRTAEQKARREWQEQWAIKPGALVILDEAGMASRQIIDNVRQLSQEANAKLLLVGDHEQLTAPTAGGMFALVVERAGAASLAEVRRFAADWERRASLRLRAGDVDVLAEYDLRARIAGGDEAEMEDAAFTAALADRARGLRPFLLADTNDQAARLAGRVRDQLVRAGTVDDSWTVNLHDGNRAGVGDRIVTRQNDRTNRAGGRFVANRDVWQVTEVHAGGAISAARVDPDSDQVLAGQQLLLDAGYVGAHVQLEYAGTVHAAQGGTRGAAHAIISERTCRQALYVALSRGVEENRAYVICNRPEGADMDGPSQDPLSVLAAIMEGNDHSEELAAIAVQERAAEQVRSLATLFPIWQDLVTAVSRERWRAAVALACGEDAAATMLASDAWPTLAARLWVIDAAGVDSAVSLSRAAAARPLAGAEDVAAVLHWRLRHVEAAAAPMLAGTFTEISPSGVDELAGAIAQVAAAMDARSDELAARVEAQQPAWAAGLGSRPDGGDTAGRQDWRRRAGIVAGYREAFGLDATGDEDSLDPIGPLPAAGRPDALQWWQRATVALDRAEPAGLAQLPDEHLEAIVEQARQAEADGPPMVADKLRAVSARLRAARTAHGEALACHGPDSPAALEVADQIRAMAAAAAELEAAQRRREQWRQTTSRLNAQAVAASAELAARAEARARTPFWDMDLPTLEAELARAGQRLRVSTYVAEHHEALTRRWQNQANELAGQLADLIANRAEVSAAQTTLAQQRAVAARIDQMQTALARGPFSRDGVRGRARQHMADELSRVLKANPTLPLDPAQQEELWTAIIDQATADDHRRLADIRRRIHGARANVEENTAIATHARADLDERSRRHAALSAEIDRRTTPSPGPAQPWSPSANPDIVPAGPEDAHQPEAARVTAPLAALAMAAPAQRQQSGRRRQALRSRADSDDETLRTALAHAEQQLRTSTAAAERFQTLTRRWQDRVDTLNAEMARITSTKPKVSIAENTVTSERATAAHIDELQSALAKTHMGRPALRGAPRQDLTEELNGLLNTNPGLRFDPVRREQRWTTIINRAKTAEDHWIADLRGQLDEALVKVADHTSLARNARLHVDRRSQLCRTLRTELHNTTGGPAASVSLDTASATRTRVGSTATESAKLRQSNRSAQQPWHPMPRPSDRPPTPYGTNRCSCP
jgi:conjugative relaxase-like TrwC/TraI family protein